MCSILDKCAILAYACYKYFRICVQGSNNKIDILQHCMVLCLEPTEFEAGIYL